jgi:UDP-glucose 4-epimerase
MSRFLVTGGAGFIGSHLADALLAAGHEVVVLDDVSTGHRANLDPRVRLHEGSILDEAALAAAIDGAAGCFHLAAISSVERCENEVVAAHRVNLEGSLRVFAAALGADVPVVYASTAAVYGDCATVPIAEDAPARPIGFYGAAKLAAEHSARLLGARRGLRSIGLRYFNVYGPRQDPRSPYSGVIAQFAAQAARGEPLTVLGSGTQTRDFVAVADIIASSLAAIGKASAAAPVVNVGTGTATRIVDLARMVCAARGLDGERHVRFGPARGSDIAHSVADTRLLRATLGFVPATALPEGLRQLAGATGANFARPATHLADIG